MLAELSIENVALVATARLAFDKGLAVLTGETGAGKSILLDALAMALGARIGTDIIRHGSERARVDAVFRLEGLPRETRDGLAQFGVDGDEDILVLSRELDRGGKGTARVNGRPVTVAQLRGIAAQLIDVHGQHEHQSLLDESRHIDLLDAWAGEGIPALRQACALRIDRLGKLDAERTRIAGDARERARETEFLTHQIAEIDAAGLNLEEPGRLATEREILSHADRLAAASETARTCLSGQTLDNLAKAVSALERMEAIDSSVTPLLESARNALYMAEDAARECRAYRDAIEFDPVRLRAIEDRLDLIRSLERKYGEGVEEILAYRDTAATRLHTYRTSEERSALLEAEIADEERALASDCAELARVRRIAAQPLATAIQSELADLAMAGTRFEVAFQTIEPGAKGADRVAFRISANVGEPSRSLAKTASGGESSRLMLALKSVLSRTQSLTTLVFDEVDAGIGGRTAAVLGKKIRSLANEVQVVCITHLAQVASGGDHHFRVEKQVDGGRTVLRIERVDGEERVKEIARMLSGDTSETALAHARELLGSR